MNKKTIADHENETQTSNGRDPASGHCDVACVCYFAVIAHLMYFIVMNNFLRLCHYISAASIKKQTMNEGKIENTFNRIYVHITLKMVVEQ